MVTGGETWGTDQKEAETSSDLYWVPSPRSLGKWGPCLLRRVSTDIPPPQSGCSSWLWVVFTDVFRSQTSPASRGQGWLGGWRWKQAERVPLLSVGRPEPGAIASISKRLWGRCPWPSRGHCPKPRVEGWRLEKVWAIGSREGLTQRNLEGG